MALIGIVIIFVSYFYVEPISKHQFDEKSVTYRAYGVTKENKMSAFIKEADRMYHIHPGEQQPVKVNFSFKKKGILYLHLFISPRVSSGNVRFTIAKNGQTLKKLILSSSKHKEQDYKVALSKQDVITIQVDKHGDIKDDIAYIQIDLLEPNYKLKRVIIPFLWSLLFIYLLGKNYKYIGVNTYIGFLLILFAEKLNFGYLDFESVLTYTILLFALTFIFVLIYQELAYFKKYKIATMVSYISAIGLYSIPLGFIIYALNYHTPFTRDALFAVFQSNSGESWEYISDYISLAYIMLFVSITVIIGLLLYIQERKETNKIEKSLILFLILVFISIVTLRFSGLRLPNFIVDGYKRYGYEISKFKEVQAKRKAGKIKFSATKEQKGETYIFIIGESLNKNHMGVYGYFRKTTPELTKMYQDHALALFDNVYSNHTHTVYVLDLALTEANQYNKKDFFDSLSILDILNKADFETYWLTNQPLYSMYDNMVSVIATAADHVVALNTSVGGIAGRHYYDEALIEKVEKVLSQKSGKNRAIFVHLGGSHSTYAERYPKDKYTVFSGELHPGIFGKKASKVKTLNPYDNSVYYNDHVVSAIIQAFEKDQSAYALFYMSDHAEDVIGGVGHQSSMFTFQMTQIPFIAYFSDKYKKVYSGRYQTFLKHRKMLFSNDMLYDTLIGIYGVKTDKYDPKYDLSSAHYHLDDKDALVLHGEKKYASKENHIYWQEVNSKVFDSSHSAVVEHVNTIGKLNELQHKGFHAFEIDTVYKDDRLKVGREPGKTGLELEAFLSQSQMDRNDSIIIDLKNLCNENEKGVIDALSQLNAQFHLQSNTTIKISDVNYIETFQNAGWRVAYRLPVEEIVPVMGNTQESKHMADRIIQQMGTQAIEILYGDDRTYLWVQKYLAPHLPNNVTYIVKFSLPLYDIHFKEKLNSSGLLKEMKIKSITITYDSQYEL